MGFNTMADALEKAGIRNTNIPQRPVRKQYQQKTSEFDPLLREQLNFAKQLSSSLVIVESNNCIEKHYTNPILEDAASHVRFIQEKIDNIEKIDTELRVLSKDLKYDFLTAEQNSRLVTTVQNFLANEKIKMQDELSALLYNTQYNNNAPVETEPVQLPVDMTAPIETTIKVSLPKKNKVTVYRSLSELTDEEKQKIRKYLGNHTKEQTSKKFNVSKYTLNSISKNTGVDILNATDTDIINHYQRFGNIGTLTKDLHVSYEKARRVLVKAGIYNKKK